MKQEMLGLMVVATADIGWLCDFDWAARNVLNLHIQIAEKTPQFASASLQVCDKDSRE